MSLTIPKVVAFGKKFDNLTTVGYELLNADGTQYQARTTTGVYEITQGYYGCNITVPDDWSGVVLWDTGEPSGATYFAEEHDFGGLMVNIISKINDILGDTNEMQGKLPSGYIMGSSDNTNKDDEIDDILDSTAMTG